jgi:hypothetical protein
MFWLSAKDWPTVNSPFDESFLLSAKVSADGSAAAAVTAAYVR